MLEDKITELAELIRSSNYFVAFTGAGVSTSAGVPDYRSTTDTVLPTGPGKWEEADTEGLTFEQYINRPNPKGYKRVETVKALPTPSHMALYQMMNYKFADYVNLPPERITDEADEESSILKFIVSQNIDGLHRKSGVPRHRIAELHGNTNLEVCQTCGQDYVRDFRTRCKTQFDDHVTGRCCDNPECGGVLHDTIVNFGESLDRNLLALSGAQSKAADLCLTLGSSLLVQPANIFPQTTVVYGGKLVIVNLQPTPIDHLAHLRINAKVDEVMEGVMSQIGLPIPQYEMKRYARLDLSAGSSFKLQGIQTDGSPFDIFKKVEGVGDGGLWLLSFHANYGEPDLEVQIADSAKQALREALATSSFLAIEMRYDTFKGQWDEFKIIQPSGESKPGHPLRTKAVDSISISVGDHIKEKHAQRVTVS